MKLYFCLLACLCLIEIVTEVRSEITLDDYMNVDPSNIIEEFRQPLYTKRADSDFWRYFLRPSGFPRPVNYGKRLSELKGIRGKRTPDVYAFKKPSRASARLRQRFYNLL